jgi:tetratricopeptide (TPR) repeat protein
VDRLSANLRERIGESLRTIRAGTPLAQVTTTSLEALRRYSEAARALDVSDYAHATQLLQEAIGLDSTFAMAYRRLAVVYGNTNAGFAKELAASRKAFELRDRLPLREHYLAEAYYYDEADPDPERAISAYRRVLDTYPDDPSALNNAGLKLLLLRRYAEAEPLFRRGTKSKTGVAYANLLRAQVLQGHIGAAESTLVAFARDLPDNPDIWLMRGLTAAAQRHYADADRIFDSLRIVDSSSAYARREAANQLATSARIRGRLADAERYERETMAMDEARGAPGVAIADAVTLARDYVRLRGQPEQAVRLVDETLRRLPLSRMDPADRPYAAVAGLYAEAGQVERAQRLMAEYQSQVDSTVRHVDYERFIAQGLIALAQRRWRDAAQAFRAFDGSPYGPAVGGMGLFELGRVYDAAGNVDSALAAYTAADARRRFYPDYGPLLERLGELYEERGDRQKALEYYGRLVDLWKDADPELQPVVKDVKQRMAKLAGERP